MVKPYCFDSYTVQFAVSIGDALGDDVAAVAGVAVVWIGVDGEVLADGADGVHPASTTSMRAPLRAIRHGRLAGASCFIVSSYRSSSPVPCTLVRWAATPSASLTVVRHSGIASSSDRYQSGIGPVDGFKAYGDSGTVGIAVLGPLEVDGQGNGLGPRDRVVLSALVVRAGDPISTEALADALWGDELPASWAKVVQGCVVRLRKRLGAAAIESGAAGYRLTLNEAEVDNRRFERLFERAREAFAGGDPEHESTCPQWPDPIPDMEHLAGSSLMTRGHAQRPRPTGWVVEAQPATPLPTAPSATATPKGEHRPAMVASQYAGLTAPGTADKVEELPGTRNWIVDRLDRLIETLKLCAFRLSDVRWRRLPGGNGRIARLWFRLGNLLR